MARMRNSLSYANVMATIAVFLALGGGAYAAISLPKGSVGTKQLKKNAVTGAKVKNGSLRAGDFKAGQLPPGPRGAQGIQGPKGDPCLSSDPNCKGPKGDQGPPGAMRAYGHIAGGGTPAVDTSRTNVGITGVVYSGGIYCVFVDPSIDLSKAVAIVTPSNVVGAVVSARPNSCASGPGKPGVQVNYTDRNGAAIQGDFTIAIP